MRGAVIFAGSIWLAAGMAFAGPFTSNGTQPVVAHQLLSSDGCRVCHGYDYDPDHRIEPADTWLGSMKANAARDPLFWAAVDVANHDVPDVGDFCIRCHVPVGWLGGRSEPPGGSTDGCGLQGWLDLFPGQDFDGVTCHTCHRMQVNPTPPPGQQSMYLENAQYWIDDTDCGGQGEPCRHGPYAYQSPDESQPPHPWVYSPYHESGDFCGNCHNVTNPGRNLIDNGVDTGLAFPMERTHREWSASAYASAGPTAQKCQDCHMADANFDPVYACVFYENNRTGDLAVHEFSGGNAWMLDVLRQEYPALNLDDELAAGRDRALYMLQQRSAEVSVVVPPVATPGGTLGVQVMVTNLTGHKLPTGYPEGRRMWLHVTAQDGNGAVLWESGAYDPGSGILTHDPALKVYESLVGIWNHNGTGNCDAADGGGASMFHFVKNDCIAKDNRIPPLGFTGGTSPELRPVGYTYPQTAPGSGMLVNYDVTGYTIPVPAQFVSPIAVTATLRYQTTSKEHVEFLRNEAVVNGFPNDCIERSYGTPDESRGALMYDIWGRNGRSAPVDMGTASGMAAIPATPGEASRQTLMRVASFNRATGDLNLTYAPACSATNHTVYIGRLANVATTTFSDEACGVGTTGAATIHLGSDSYFWLIVGNDGVKEGSYGTKSPGVERPEDTTFPGCNLPQDLSQRCDP